MCIAESKCFENQTKHILNICTPLKIYIDYTNIFIKLNIDIASLKVLNVHSFVIQSFFTGLVRIFDVFSPTSFEVV